MPQERAKLFFVQWNVIFGRNFHLLYLFAYHQVYK